MIKYEKPHSKTLLVLDTRKDVLAFMSVLLAHCRTPCVSIRLVDPFQLIPLLSQGFLLVFALCRGLGCFFA
jgi:hypothetical protein